MVQAAQAAGLLYVWRNVVQVVMSYPVGVLADRIGHLPVLVAGYFLGAATAVLTALAFLWQVESLSWLALIFACAGLYMAVQEALETTVASGLVGAGTLATGIGTLGAINGVNKSVASTAVGVGWTLISPAVAFGLAGALMVAGTLALTRLRN